MPDEPDLGRIVLADFVDPQGKRAGIHPAIVLSDRATIEAGEPLLTVVISTSTHLAAIDEMVPMPYHPGGHPITKLDEAGAAICYWLSLVPSSEIRGYKGRVYGRLLADVAARVKLMQERGKLILTRRP